jgi:hypothetical protein
MSMGRFQRSDRAEAVDVRRALRDAQAEVARNRGEPPPEDERGEEQRRLEEVENAMREHDARKEAH